MNYEGACLDIMNKISYLQLNMLYLTIDRINFSSQYLHFRKKIARSLSHALKISRYYRVNNKHGGRMLQGKVGYLTIF